MYIKGCFDRVGIDIPYMRISCLALYSVIAKESKFSKTGEYGNITSPGKSSLP